MSDVDFIDQFETEKEYERSLLLSALCIFTWIGCWLIALYYGLRIIKVNDIERSIYHFDEWKLEYDLMKVGVVTPIISAVGAYFIWKMRRFGLFIYGAGQFILAAFGLYVYCIVKPIENPVSYYFIAGFLAQLAFIAPYFINWKYLR
jgi:hypothetical protein